MFVARNKNILYATERRKKLTQKGNHNNIIARKSEN